MAWMMYGAGEPKTICSEGGEAEQGAKRDSEFEQSENKDLFDFICQGFKMWLLIIFLSIATVGSLSLGSDKEPKLYDPEAYYSALQNEQDQFQIKIDDIKEQIKGIQAILNDTEMTKSVRVVQLSEAMADERDSLYQMEQILKLPYELRECKCASLDDDKKAEINNKIDEIASSISDMKNSLKKCSFDRCPRYQELLLELNQEQNYLNIINETINSECCQKEYILEDQNATGMADLSGSLYKDNLKADNWFYGSISRTEYLLQRFELATKYNLTSCPLVTPYVDFYENKCFNCTDGGNFSLGDRRCFACSPNEYLNTTTSTCVQCPDFQHYNQTSKLCESCKIGTIYNKEQKACLPCAKNEFPVYTTNQCQKCQPHHYFNQTLQQCVTCRLNKGEYLNETTYECVYCPNGQYFSPNVSKCVSCPGVAHYNSTSEKCVLCPNNTHFMPERNTCESCPKDSFYNNFTNECQTCPPGYVYNTTLSICMPDQADVIGHEKCPSSYPYYNKYADKCEKCPIGEYFNQTEMICKKKKYISICPPESPIYNSSTLSCKPCPPSTPEYDPYYHICISCPTTKPVYNTRTYVCEPCPVGQVYNPSTGICSGSPVTYKNTTSTNTTNNTTSVTSPQNTTSTNVTNNTTPVTSPQNTTNQTTTQNKSNTTSSTPVSIDPIAVPAVSTKNTTSPQPTGVDPTVVSPQPTPTTSVSPTAVPGVSTTNTTSPVATGVDPTVVQPCRPGEVFSKQQSKCVQQPPT